MMFLNWSNRLVQNTIGGSSSKPSFGLCSKVMVCIDLTKHLLFAYLKKSLGKDLCNNIHLQRTGDRHFPFWFFTYKGLNMEFQRPSYEIPPPCTLRINRQLVNCTFQVFLPFKSLPLWWSLISLLFDSYLWGLITSMHFSDTNLQNTSFNHTIRILP